MRKTLIAVAAVALIGGVAIAQQPMQMPMMDMMMPKDGDAASTKGYKMSMMKMMKDMPHEFTGNADVDFMRQMRAHHQGAIEMSEVAIQHGRDDDVKRLARKIVDDQRKEIAEIDAWLAKRRP
jgi:uncharacterized protein (DUF305 family)